MKTNAITGFHHLTAMAADPSANIHFYTNVLGLRLVKVTVNFDDPSTYHLYYGDQLGSPGSIITFFPWGNGSHSGEHGRGEISAFTLRVPANTLPAWQKRLTDARIAFAEVTRPEGETIEFIDDSGHKVRLWAHGDPLSPDRIVPTSPVPATEQIIELAGAEFTVGEAEPTQNLLKTMGLTTAGNQRYTFAEGVQHIDIIENAALPRMRFGTASTHHLAFQVTDDEDEIHWQTKLTEAGYGVTEVKDRNYFNSVYLREPGGIVLELATLAPGFAVDEPVESLGTTLKLPPEYEPHRHQIVQQLQPLPMVNPNKE